MPRASLAVALVVKNGARTLRRTLESVAALRPAPEVVALDSGSTDATLDILEAFGARVHHVQWRGFAATKNDAMSRCSSDWVLNLDADESLTPALAASIERALDANDPAIAGYELNRKVWWGGFLHHVWQPEWRLRLVRRSAATWGGYEPHSSLELTADPAGASAARRVARLAGDLRHDAFDTMEEFLAKQVGYSRQGAESYLRMGRRASALSLVASPVGAWCKQVIGKQAWRDGWRGMACAGAVATAALMKHAILLELQRAPKPRAIDGPGEPPTQPAARPTQDAAPSTQDAAAHG